MTLLMKPYEAILFDFDGVLADTEPIHYQAWAQILQDYGIQLDWDFYVKSCIGISDRLMIETLSAQREPPIPFDDIWNRYPEKHALFQKLAVSGAVFHDETIRLVKSLTDYKLAVVSSSARPEIEPLLRGAGILDCFAVLVCGREVPNLKPAPDPYLRAAELLGVSGALVVEDSNAGEASGRAAGFPVLRVKNSAEVAERVRAALGIVVNA